MTDTTPAEILRRSKARWGSYAIDHDGIDALAALLSAVEEQEEPSKDLMDAYGALVAAIRREWSS